ncbi:Cytochrome P450 monooxygenase aclL [Cladobotryum mycophilum]|uniref:Cytochrome P450 monooxygenase aclL n=1 Tax=Cladobotryum mycophilum TaxID=491253 RepID=A0ABR0SZA9_9HYPO
MIPGNTIVSVPFLATFWDEKNFSDPLGFHPERFLGDENFANHNTDAFQPFNVGPRRCIGQAFAYGESRLALAKLIFSFDMKLASENKDWINSQKAYLTWDKPPLNVFLRPVR